MSSGAARSTHLMLVVVFGCGVPVAGTHAKALSAGAESVVSGRQVACRNRQTTEALRCFGQYFLPISHQVLASRRTLTPESLSRVLNELSSWTLITVPGRHVRIHGLLRLREFDL